MIQYLTLLICAGFVGALIYRYDLYEKEPPKMIFFGLVVGAVGMWLIGGLEDLTLRLWGGVSPPAICLAAVMALHEELGKALGVYVISITARNQFNDPLDGLIYGSLVGLGAAVFESVFYLEFAYPGAKELPAGEVIRIVGHPVMGGMAGYAVGMWRLKIADASPAPGVALAAAIGVHFLWDWLSYSASAQDGARWAATAGAAIMLAGFIIYGWLAISAANLSRNVFAPGSKRSLWGWPFRR